MRQKAQAQGQTSRDDWSRGTKIRKPDAEGSQEQNDDKGLSAEIERRDPTQREYPGGQKIETKHHERGPKGELKARVPSQKVQEKYSGNFDFEKHKLDKDEEKKADDKVAEGEG